MRARKQERKQRIPFGVMSQKLNVDADTMKRLESEEKVPRWINDKDNRIENALAGGYEFVLASREPISAGDKQEVQEEDRKIRKYVGTRADRSPMYAYLMAIPKKYYDEDKAAKEERNKMVDRSIKEGNPNGVQHHGVSSSLGGTYSKVDYKP